MKSPETFTATLEAAGEAEQFEALIEGLISSGAGICDGFFTGAEVAGLRHNLLHAHDAGEMHPAGVGRKFDYVKNAQIRGDVIRWIEPASRDPYERAFLDKVSRFIGYLNATCYTGINGYEFHYAFYETGSFYKRHLDRFKSDRGRQFSFVLYLNDAWLPEHGGGLSLYLEHETVTVLPIGGRAVFFRSDETEHEVHPSPVRPRLSIAGWLKKV